MSSKPKRRRTSKTLVSSQTPSTHGPLSNTQYSSPLPGTCLNSLCMGNSEVS